MKAEDLHVERWGAGPAVLLVHGDVVTGSQAWARQRPLAECWGLVVPDRPGAGRSAAAGRVDFEREAVMLEPLLGDGAHLLGHSYGALIALLMAAARPELVRSLTVVEPPAYAVAAAHPDVIATVTRLERLFAEHQDDPAKFFAEFVAIVGERPWPRPPMPAPMQAGVRRLMTERPPWEAEVDLARLAAAGVPVLVVSGGHSPAFEAVCDAIATEAAARRVVLAGARHSVQRTGEPFNRLLQHFWSSIGSEDTVSEVG